MKYVIKQHKSAKVCDTSMLCIYQHLGVCTHIYKKHLIPSSLLSTHFLFLPSVVWSRAIRLSFFPFHWHPTVSFLFFIASCLTLTSRPLSLFCFFPPSSLLLFFHHFFFLDPLLLFSVPVSWHYIMVLLLMRVCARLWLHRWDDIMSHNLSFISQRARAGCRLPHQSRRRCTEQFNNLL